MHFNVYILITFIASRQRTKKLDVNRSTVDRPVKGVRYKAAFYVNDWDPRPICHKLTLNIYLNTAPVCYSAALPALKRQVKILPKGAD